MKSIIAEHSNPSILQILVISHFLVLSDINECEEGRAICNKMTEVCINTKGDYWCAPAHKPVRATTSSTTTITSTTTTTTTTPAPPPLPPRPQAPQCPPGTLYNTAYRSCRGRYDGWANRKGCKIKVFPAFFYQK